MLKYIDSHAHYDDSAFDADRNMILSEIHESGVMKIINIGCDLNSCESSAELSKKYDFIYFAAGIHPENISGLKGDWEEKIRGYLSYPKCAAMGEIGLDYHYEGFDREKQIEIFSRQLEIANELDIPVIIHSRDASGDTLDILRKYKPKGVLHCYSGSPETAREVISLGMYIGFTGVLTFKNAKKAVKTAECIPADRILVETDCPYMAPEPFRGQRSDSRMIVKVIEKLAEIKNLSPEEIAEITAKNTETLFEGIK